jgi:hypothetical protein
MLNLELRVLGTPLFEFRFGREAVDPSDWLRGYEGGRWDREYAEAADDVDEDEDEDEDGIELTLPEWVDFDVDE